MLTADKGELQIMVKNLQREKKSLMQSNKVSIGRNAISFHLIFNKSKVIWKPFLAIEQQIESKNLNFGDGLYLASCFCFEINDL